MKKQLFFVCLMLAIAPALFAQQALLSKKGKPILPQQGEFAIGIGADPFLNYFGNIFGGDSESPSLKSPDLTVFGKYFIKDDLALRMAFQMNFSSEKTFHDIETPETPGGTETESPYYNTLTGTDLMLKVGIEKRLKRLADRRVQVYYGADLGIGYDGKSDKIHFDDNNSMKKKYDRDFKLGLSAFVGVEYFFAPKISVGGEIGYGMECHFGVKDKTQTIVDGKTEVVKAKLADSGVKFGDIVPANIRVMFYF